MDISSISLYSRSDLDLVLSIGAFVRQTRIGQDKTQQEIADAAGVNRTTLSLLEKGKPVNLLSLIQVLRALRSLDILSAFDRPQQLSPLQLAALERNQRKRAGRKRATGKPQSDW